MSELVAIRRESGKRSLIRAADYDPAKHVLWDAPPAAPAPPPAPAPEPPRRGRHPKARG